MPEPLTDAQKVVRNDTGKRIAVALESLASEVTPSGVIAPEYDPTATYAVGDMVIFRSVLYRCTTAITTPEEWTAAHWTATMVSDAYRQAVDQDAIDANLMALGLSGASVGDLVRVAAVDTNGKPTSWEPVRFVNTHLRKWDVATCGKIIFVGNSYAKDSTAWAKWPDVAAQTLGLGTEGINWWNIGYPGSSMTTNSTEPPSFLALLTTWVSGHADELNNIGAVVCVAGLNDSNVNSEPLLPAAITTLSNYVRTTFPHAKMYFGYTGFVNQQVNKSKPIEDQSPATDEYIRRALMDYINCIKDGALYLGGVENVIHQKSLLDTDGIHPNQEGAAQLGRAVANALLQGYCPQQSTETAFVTYEREYGFAYGNMNQSSVNGIQSTVINLGFRFYDDPQSGNPDFSHCPTWTAGDVFTAGKISLPFTNGLEATDILMSVYALNVGNILCNCRVAVDKETNELKFRIGAFSTGGSSYQILIVSAFATSSSAPLFKDLYTTV